MTDGGKLKSEMINPVNYSIIIQLPKIKENFKRESGGPTP
jgi:hypothetical protein